MTNKSSIGQICLGDSNGIVPDAKLVFSTKKEKMLYGMAGLRVQYLTLGG